MPHNRILPAALPVLATLVTARADTVHADPVLHAEPVVASWYGAQFENRLMANGCRFQAAALTAASKTLPLGTLVLLTRGEHKVVVTITDRGPYVKGRQLDLSRAAAERLDMRARGVAPVQMEVIGSQQPSRCRLRT